MIQYRKNLHLVFNLLLCTMLNCLCSHALASEEADALVQYIEMKPSFVLNYGPPSAKLRYAKVDISLRVDTRSAASTVEHHMPALRNEIVLLLSKQNEDMMGNTEGREKLRLEALVLLKEFLDKEAGSTAIEDLLFTSFVVQR